MSATFCISEFDRAIRALPAVTTSAIRALTEAQPRTCERDGCSPGGCRKHCIAYAEGVVHRHRIHAAKAAPRKGKGK